MLGRRITSWSFSRFTEWLQCPAKARYKFVLRLPEPSNRAMERGIAIHAALDGYITGKLRSLSGELVHKNLVPYVKSLRALYKRQSPGCEVASEATWAFTKSWVPTTYDDWNNCYVRIKTDCIQFLSKHEAIVTDWKTGKVYADNDKELSYEMQLELYAVGAMYQYPQLKEVSTRLAYVDHGTTYPENAPSYHRKQLDDLTRRWDKRVLPMLNDTTFPTRPSSNCRWCHFRRDNGGPCKY